MYFVMQKPGVTVIRMVLNTDEINADGYQELKPDELFFGQRAADLREGVYDPKGEFVSTLLEYQPVGG